MRSNKGPIDEGRLATMRMLRDAGLTVREIAVIYGIKKSAVSRYLIKHRDVRL
jgi:predicted transcriptional regulator